MTSSRRMLDYIEFKGIKKTNFYKITGLSNGYLDKVSEIGSDKIASILNYFPSLNTYWLITGNGSMEISESNIVDSKSIPVYPHIASAGKVQLFKDMSHSQSEGYISVPQMPRCDGAIPIVGDSMYPLLKSGDLVCYQIKEVCDLIYGEMYLVDWLDSRDDDYLTVKYIQKGSNGDTLRLVSYNKNHEDIEVRKDRIRQLALVKLTVRFNSL